MNTISANLYSYVHKFIKLKKLFRIILQGREPRSGRSSYKAEFNLTVPIHPSPSLTTDQMLSPPMAEKGFHPGGNVDQSRYASYACMKELGEMTPSKTAGL